MKRLTGWFSTRVTAPALSILKIDQPAKLLVRIFDRLGQDCRVIRNPIMDGILLEQVLLVPAYAGNARQSLRESY